MAGGQAPRAALPPVQPRPRRLPWPKRFDIALLSFLALVIAYCDRMNMSVAAPSIMQEYGWDTARMRWALTGFFIGYTAFMVPTGMLVDRYGARRVFAFSIGWWSVFTALTPLPRGLAALTATRVIMGAGESGTFPSINSILIRWFPLHEYSRAAGFCWSGGYAGSIVAFPLAAVILNLWGWRAVFFSFAALGAAWVPVWLAAASRPELPERARAPVGKLLRAPALWAVLALHFSSNWFPYVT